MKYLGSKNRIAKYILPIILKDRKEDQWYIEPFCGGCNTIDKVAGNRMASDSHFELIEMWKELQSGWIPPYKVSEDYYKQVKINFNEVYPAYLRGYIGFNISFSGKWWGGMARYTSPVGKVQHFDEEAYRFVTRQLPSIKGIEFYHGTYDTFLDYPPNSIIYCDPPYRGTTKYKDGLDYEHFYQWCRDMKAKGHTIFISEYNMPYDFTCIWEKPVIVNLTNQTKANKAIERLYSL